MHTGNGDFGYYGWSPLNGIAEHTRDNTVFASDIRCKENNNNIMNDYDGSRFKIILYIYIILNRATDVPPAIFDNSSQGHPNTYKMKNM